MAINASDSSNEDELELRMTSMIDVVFLLLIFFIVTLKIPEEEAIIETRLPQAAGSGETTSEEEEEKSEFEDIMLVLQLDPQSGETRTEVGGQIMRSSEQLARRLQGFQNLNDEGRVVIECGDDVPYRDLVEAISVVQYAELPMAFGDIN